MKRWIQLIAAALVAGAAGPVQSLDRLAGVYRYSFPNGTVDGGKYQSENILEIVPRSATSAYFRTHLEFFNGHICDLWGIADLQDGALVYNGPLNLQGQPCRLHLAETNGKIVFSDPGEACRVDSCGARGLYDGTAFPLTARRPIRYMPRLLSSSEYADAVRWHDQGKLSP